MVTDNVTDSEDIVGKIYTNTDGNNYPFGGDMKTDTLA